MEKDKEEMRVGGSRGGQEEALKVVLVEAIHAALAEVY